MSNEELAERIRDGDKAAIPELWDGVKSFIHQQAFRYFRYCPVRGGTELEDLVQSSFIAMMDAAQSYKSDMGCGFLTYLDFYLRNEFRKCFGLYSKKPDPLNENPRSLNEPIAEDKGDGTLADTIQDPGDPIGDAERRIWLEQLRSALDAALDQLPRDQQQTLKARYYQGKTLEDTATASGIPEAEVRKLERRGLDQLRKQKHRNGLDQFIDSQTDFYNYVSVDTFNTTHSSAVEKAVLFRENIREQISKKERMK